MKQSYEITFTDGSIETVECDGIQQNGNIVVFMDVKAVADAGGQRQGEIVLWANTDTVKMIKLVRRSLRALSN